MERLFLVLIFGSVAALASLVFGPSARERAVNRRVSAVRPGRQDPLALEDQELAQPFSQRVLGPAVASLRSQLLRFAPVSVRRRAEDKLLRAGRPMEVGSLFAVRFLLLTVMLVFGVLMAMVGQGTSVGRNMATVIGFTFAGYVLPDLWLGGKVNKRRQAIEHGLPDVLDLLTISVEAGLGFDAAIQKVAEKFKGPVGEEFQEYIKEVKLGRPRVEALRGLSRRADLEDMKTFVASLIQAEQLGVSLAQVLRIQADQMRYRRRQRAQERAMKMPIKMLFPLVFFILPTIFIVLFAPLAVHLMEVFRAS
ncbi:MAG: type II secretion system F family protein [Bacillota bacterium]|nr:type II secretion system F family protein [Bacillota bacterium]